MFDDKAAGKQRIFIEAVQEGITEHVGDLQLGAEHHRKDKEDGHALVFKQRESVKPQHLRPALITLGVSHRDRRQRQGEQRQQYRQRRTDVQLHMAQLKAGEADAPHGEDKADSAPDTDRRKIGNDIQPRRLQAIVRDGVNQPQRRHIGQRVEEDHEEHFARRGDLRRQIQRQRTHQVTNGIHPFGANPLIGDDAEQRRHQHRGDTERAINRADCCAVKLQGDKHV